VNQANSLVLEQNPSFWCFKIGRQKDHSKFHAKKEKLRGDFFIKISPHNRLDFIWKFLYFYFLLLNVTATSRIFISRGEAFVDSSDVLVSSMRKPGTSGKKGGSCAFSNQNSQIISKFNLDFCEKKLIKWRFVMSELLIYQPSFRSRDGEDRPIYYLRVAEDDGACYVLKVIDRYTKTGRIIADCDLEEFAFYHQFTCTPDHWGYIDLCQLLRDKGVRGYYLNYLHAVELDKKELAEKERYDSSINISFRCSLKEDEGLLWKIRGLKTEEEREEAEQLNEQLKKLSPDERIKKLADRLLKERGLRRDEEAHRAKIAEMRERLKSSEVTPTTGDKEEPF